VALFTQGIRASQECSRIHSPREQGTLKTDDDFLVDAPPMFGGALLDSLVKFVRDALDRNAWHAGTSMVLKRNHFGTIVSTAHLSVKFPIGLLTGRTRHKGGCGQLKRSAFHRARFYLPLPVSLES
jgi:hypothetical protein